MHIRAALKFACIVSVCVTAGFLLVVRFSALTRGAHGSHAEGVPSSGMAAVVVSATGETLRSVYEGLPANPSRVAAMDRLQKEAMTPRVLKCVPAPTAPASVVGESVVTHQVSLPAGRDHPAEVKFQNGRLVLVFRNATPLPGSEDDSVVVLDRNGRELFARSPGQDVPDTRVANISDATLGGNGVLVIAMALVDTGGRASAALMEYQVTDGHLLRIVRTNPVRCLSVAADGDKVWCLGYNEERKRLRATDYDVVYRFAESGKLVQSLFPRGSLCRDPSEWRGRNESQLVALHGEFAAWLPASDALLRWRSDGTNARQLSAAPPTPEDSKVGDQIGMLADGQVVGLVAAAKRDGEPSRPVRTAYLLTDAGQFSRLASWSEVSTGDTLAGTDGTSLVFFRSPTRSMVWLDLTTSPSKPPTAAQQQ